MNNNLDNISKKNNYYFIIFIIIVIISISCIVYFAFNIRNNNINESLYDSYDNENLDEAVSDEDKTSDNASSDTNTSQNSDNSSNIDSSDSSNSVSEDKSDAGDSSSDEEKTVNPTSINLSKTSITMNISESVTVSATILPNNSTNKDLTWTSSDPSIATVSNSGKITGISAGSTTITVKTFNNISKTIKVTVNSIERIHFISHDEAGSSVEDHITGDAILLESNGHYAMIDLGNTSKVTNVVNYLKNKGVTKLDFVLLTHMDNDHAANLSSLYDSGIKISNLWMKKYDSSATESALTKYNKYYNLAVSNGSNVKNLSSADDGASYTFKYLKFKLTVYNNKMSANASINDNYNSLVLLYEITNNSGVTYKALLTGDLYDTKILNTIASKVGKVDVFKVPHHGSRFCALIAKNYNGNTIDSNGNLVSSTALSSLNPKYYVVTSSEKKISHIRSQYSVSDGNMCVDYIPSGKTVYYVDTNKSALIVDFTGTSLKFLNM